MNIRRVRPHQILTLTPGEGTLCVSIYASCASELSKRIEELENAGTAIAALRALQRFAAKATFPSAESTIGIFHGLHAAAYTHLPFKARSLLFLAGTFHIKPILKWVQRERPFILLYMTNEDGLIYEGAANSLRRLPQAGNNRRLEQRNSWHALTTQVDQVAHNSGRPIVLMGKPILVQKARTLLGHHECVVAQSIVATEEATLPDLHHACLAALEPFWLEHENRLIESYWKEKSRHRTSAKLQEIAELAKQGRIAHLFINETLTAWCQGLGSETYYLHDRPFEGYDLLDDVAEQVLTQGGTVTPLRSERMPEKHAAAAVLRREIDACDTNEENASSP